MTEEIARSFCCALRDALLECEPEHIAPLLHDDCEWTLLGPVDLFPFFGTRRGKDAVLGLCSRIISSLQFVRCETEIATYGETSAAAMVRITALHMQTGRTLSFRVCHFLTFRDGKVASLRALVDGFDAAEQVLGREIDLSAAA